MRRGDRQGSAAEDAVLRLVQDHAAELLRFARRFSLCADDAHDAYQRGIEILVRRMRTSPPDNPLNWLRTVIRHECVAVRVDREQLVGRQEVDLDREEGSHLEDPSERIAGYERLGRVAEALQRLKPQEVTALVLRAEGLSYKEICARTGWSYTRCNRAVYEGRRALAERLDAIESGAECERWTPLLSVLADGEATAAELSALRPHLRSCAACRATLRGFHAAPAQVAALVPPALVPLAAEPGSSLLGHVELALHAVAERTTLAAMRVQGALEGLTGTRIAAVAASTAAIAGGGAALEQATRADRVPAADGGSAAVTSVAPAGLAVAPRLMTIVDPLSSRSASAPRARRSTRGEFAAPPPPARRAEFAARSSAAREFSSAAPTVATASASPGPSTPVAQPRAPSEFGSP